MIIYFVLGLVAYLLWDFLEKTNKTEPPVLPGKLPVVGHLFKFCFDTVQGLYKACSECNSLGGASTLYLGRKIYFLTDPEDCYTVCNACLGKYYIYEFFKPVIKESMFACDVPTWKKYRKLLTPAFSQQVLESFVGIFNHHANVLVKQFAKEMGKPFDHEQYLRINNFQVICDASFGIPADEIGNVPEMYLPTLERGLEVINERVLKFWYHSEFIFNMSALKKKESDVVEKMNEVADTILREKKAKRKSQSAPVYGSGKFKPFMDLILELADDNPEITDDVIKGETSSIIIAGQEGSSSALTFAMTLLGSHPKVQERAYKEIMEVLGDKEYIDTDDLSKFVYIEAVLKEILRLYPTAPIIMRQLDKDVKLKNFTLKAGHGCMLSVYGSLRHPMWGPDADQFRPERWFNKDSVLAPQYNAAFGLGRRACIGKLYAMMSMKITLANVLRRYEISSDVNNMKLKMKTWLRPGTGFYITLKERE